MSIGGISGYPRGALSTPASNLWLPAIYGIRVAQWRVVSHEAWGSNLDLTHPTLFRRLPLSNMPITCSLPRAVWQIDSEVPRTHGDLTPLPNIPHNATELRHVLRHTLPKPFHIGPPSPQRRNSSREVSTGARRSARQGRQRRHRQADRAGQGCFPKVSKGG